MPNVAISFNDYLVKENPRLVMEGAEPIYSLTVEGATTIVNDGTLAMYAYKGGIDLSSTFLTGSISASGNIVTLKKLHALKGGDKLFVTVFGTVDGVLDCLGAFDVFVLRKSGK